MKLCRHCNETKPLAEFYRFASGRMHHICKACHRRRMKLNRLTNPHVQERDRARAMNPERQILRRRTTKAWRQNHPEAYRAQTAVGNAIRDGHLIRLPCFLCGNADSVHAHHRDYSQPFAVTWLCAKCHHRLHAAFPELGGHK
jgi:hypothetical protein